MATATDQKEDIVRQLMWAGTAEKSRCFVEAFLTRYEALSNDEKIAEIERTLQAIHLKSQSLKANEAVQGLVISMFDGLSFAEDSKEHYYVSMMIGKVESVGVFHQTLHLVHAVGILKDMMAESRA